VIRPLLEAASPRVVVEVGAARGDTTAALLEFAESCGATLHSIDPSPNPAFEPEALSREHGGRFMFHRGLSLEVLPQLGAVDAAIIDGDHNWYTVFHELQALAQCAQQAGRPFPLTFLHDVEWPYGRRDGYYNPATIPAEHLQPHRKAGIVRGQSELADRRGVNRGLNNAVEEGTPRNGVLTAVEDFLEERGSALDFHRLPGFHGLGIIVSADQAQRNERLRACLAEFDSPAWLKDHCRRIEQARLALGQRLAARRSAGTGQPAARR
jgi:Methyltransferase domain